MVIRQSDVRHLAIVPLFLASMAIGAGASAQVRGDVSGRVLHWHTGEPVDGIQVSVTGMQIEETTDQEGRFRLSGLSEGRHELGFYLLGCRIARRTVEIRGGEEARLDVAVGSQTIEVAGLVVDGSGDADDADRTFSTARLAGEELRPSQARGVADLIRGLPGVRVVQGTGQPGSAMSVQLRGPTSVQGDQNALVVVDGVPAGTRLSEIDPMDVERIEILRGPNAAAAYGSRGQAGVIEITTKRGVEPELPLLVVDGDLHEGSLASIPPQSIAAIDVLHEEQAQLLFGLRGRGGVISVTTRQATDVVDASSPSYCGAP